MAQYNSNLLPQISEEKLDSEKERRQILNYLALLDEKLRYMFQNIDPSENFSEGAFQNYIKTEKMITSLQIKDGKISALITDMEGNFSLLVQTVNGIQTTVADQAGKISQMQQTAEGILTRVSDAEGNISALEQTAGGIQTSVRNLEGNVSTLEQTANNIKTSVRNLEGDVSVIEQQADKIDWIIASGTSATRFTLTSKMAELIADEIDIYGVVTFNDLSRSGRTEINGDNITTGEISADYIHLGDLMEIHRTGVSSIVGGYIGYGNGDDGDASNNGIVVMDKNQDNYFIATTSGVRMTYWEETAVYCISGSVNLVAGSYGVKLDDTNGNLCPTVDDDQLLGKSTRLWQGLYAGNATIQTSDARKKHSIEYDMEKYADFFCRLKPTQYKLNNGSSDRFHTGFISQDVEQALEESGLTSKDFAGFIKSPVHEKELKNGDFDETTPIIDYNYALRYEEFTALNTYMIQKLMRRVEELEARVAELEGIVMERKV